jgi:hypothetical protein
MVWWTLTTPTRHLWKVPRTGGFDEGRAHIQVYGAHIVGARVCQRLRIVLLALLLVTAFKVRVVEPLVKIAAPGRLPRGLLVDLLVLIL